VQPILNFLSIIFYEPIFNALMLIYHGVHDYGLAIIILTIIVRFALVPLTFQQLRSSKVMQELQPKLKELQRRYANDKERLMREQMALYREHKYNPVSGCLPLLIQLPFLYGLFYALRNVFQPGMTVAKLNEQIYPFLPKLSALPSTYLNWFAFLPGSPHLNLAVSDPTHILPIIAALATFVQMRMAQPRQNRSSKDTQTAVMSQMSYIMPLVTGFFAWTFPAGLALYWTVSTLFTMTQQYFITGWGSLPALIPASLFGAAASGDGSTPPSSAPQTPAKGTDGAVMRTEKLRRSDGEQSGNGADHAIKTPDRASAPGARPPQSPIDRSAAPSVSSSVRRQRSGAGRGAQRSRHSTAQRNRPVLKPKGGEQ